MILITSLIAFVSSNVDDLLLLAVLFAQAKSKKENQNILIGQYVGILLLLLVSYLMATVWVHAINLPVRWLGVIPILLAIKQVLPKKGGSQQQLSQVSAGQVALLTIASGSDNIGLYVPIIGQQTLVETLLSVGVFILIIPLWWWLGQRLGDAPGLRNLVQRHGSIVVAVIYFLLGLWVLFG
ncbi:cadmium resistance transporter [Lactobacillaceae bacterium L1_55_11]|nr:cadmium resistance transporter [Lactobacillaceae bacterium L1_55_11]